MCFSISFLNSEFEIYKEINSYYVFLSGTYNMGSALIKQNVCISNIILSKKKKLKIYTLTRI